VIDLSPAVCYNGGVSLGIEAGSRSVGVAYQAGGRRRPASRAGRQAVTILRGVLRRKEPDR
jgi:hypothetical protein